MILERKQTVLVTGASSSLGRSVIEELSLRGHDVISTQHTDAGKPSYFDLSMPTVNSLPGFKIDSVVSIAWDMQGRSPAKQAQNVEGTLVLLKFATRNQARFIFVSTNSAESDGSEYGRAKLRAEDAVAQYRKGVTIRAGILIGANPTPIQSSISKLAIFPGICFHLHPDRTFDVSKVEQIARVIAIICEGGTAISPRAEAMRLSNIVHLLAKPRLKLHLSVPWQIPYQLLRLADNVRCLKLPKSDSLLVLAQDERCRNGYVGDGDSVTT
jgi:nucleoside-diphosphate-sugar epimerase